MTTDASDQHFGDVVAMLRAREQEQAILLHIGHRLAAARDRRDLLDVLPEDMLQVLSGKFYTLSLIDPEGETYSSFLHTPETELRATAGDEPVMVQSHPVRDGIFDAALAAEGPIIFHLARLLKTGRAPEYIGRWHRIGIVELAVVRIVNGDTPLGVLSLYSDEEHALARVRPELLLGIAAQIGTGISNVLANERIAQQLRQIEGCKLRLEEENRYQQEAQLTDTSNNIYGESAAIKTVFRLVDQVAASDATVLLLGETGTGKELAAKAIHARSGRARKPMIRINCAALPANLIESELFGHERGAFTGAGERRIGKFELAHNSTLFLDEIGELPPELQVKLLRVLQQREFERIGGNQTIRVNVRILAATNRDLQHEVAAGRFRADLYYRLNVFPITLPPLRERRTDIPLLAQHFIAMFARSNGRRVCGIGTRALEVLQGYSWPGNVRELEHLIERSVLLATGPQIREILLPESPARNGTAPRPFGIRPLSEVERDYIIEALKLCNGRVSGPAGVAVRLGLPATTLLSRMKKLGIRKEHFFSPPDSYF
jgi:transcriptional regulator with GAF, ATPase, and Fis domain